MFVMGENSRDYLKYSSLYNCQLCISKTTTSSLNETNWSTASFLAYVHVDFDKVIQIYYWRPAGDNPVKCITTKLSMSNHCKKLIFVFWLQIIPKSGEPEFNSRNFQVQAWIKWFLSYETYRQFKNIFLLFQNGSPKVTSRYAFIFLSLLR